MRKIVFVNPPVPMKERYGGFALAGSTMPSLGVAFLAAVCRKNGYDVEIIEAAAGKESYDAIVSRVIDNDARFVGITAMTSTITSAARLAETIKQRKTDVKILIGGPHVTALPEATMRQYPWFDIGFCGEAETSLADYLASVDNGSDIGKVRGIVYHDGTDITRTDPQPFIEDLDMLPMPAWDLIPGFPHAYHPSVQRCIHPPAGHLTTSRGCPMHCTFCDRSVFGTRYRLFSIEYIGEMLRILTGTYGVRDILFEDDSFTLNKERVLSLCRVIRTMPVRFSWSCLGRIDTIDTEIVREMKRAGCWQIGFGIESGNAVILKAAEKKINLERIQETLAMTRAAGIRTKGFFILGLPSETHQSMHDSLRFALATPLDDVSVSFATPFPGTCLYDEAHRTGTFYEDWQKMNLLTAVYIPAGLSKTGLERFHSRFIRRFYLRSSRIVDYLLRCSGDMNMLVRIVRSAFAILRTTFTRALHA